MSTHIDQGCDVISKTQNRSLYNPNTFVGLVGEVRKDYLPKEEGREGGVRRARGSNPGPAAC